MDNLYYEIITPVVSFVSLIVFIAIISFRIVSKSKPKVFEWVCILVCLLGMYLYLPFTMYNKGYLGLNESQLNQAAKISINPYEKRLCYMAIADVYRFKKDGDKIIEYKEKALKGAYKKYPEETLMLALWYSIKGDSERVMEINQIIPNCMIPLRSIYIQNGEYQKALDTFRDYEKSAGSNLLRAALYKELGNFEKANEYRTLANEQIKKNVSRRKNLDNFESIDSFKKFISSKKIEYGFKDEK